MKTAVYAGTRNLYQDMIPAVKSLLINSDVDKVYFLIEDDKFPYPLPDIIECMNVSEQTYFIKGGPNYELRWTYMVLMRAALTKVLPNEDKILSLDIDTIINHNISELWNTDISRHYLAAVKEPKKSTINEPYFNMGVALFNLKKLRVEHMDDLIIHKLNTVAFPFAEQDCINRTCGKQILSLSNEYNVNKFTGSCNNPKILHYAAIKHWNDDFSVRQYRNIPWENIRGGTLCVI